MSGGSPTSLKAMLEFLYIGNYDGLKSTSPAQRVLEHLEILVIGHTCEPSALQSIAEKRFETALKQESDDLWLVMPILVREVYLESWRANTRIRQLLVEKTVENLRELLKNKEFKQVLEISIRFAFHVAQATAQRLGTVTSSSVGRPGKEPKETEAALQKTHGLLMDCSKALYISEQSRWWTE
ncbi:uncharacterized protein IWZ02DRAFT_461186 [Phyllosticta citriasiana]|uniref:uncharacterized protein n=1 Tax=Phyllosticta citriasiana TaxID=595635 RepID=UPI0030FDCDE4